MMFLDQLTEYLQVLPCIRNITYIYLYILYVYIIFLYIYNIYILEVCVYIYIYIYICIRLGKLLTTNCYAFKALQKV